MRRSSANFGFQLPILRKMNKWHLYCPSCQRDLRKKIDWNVAHSFPLAIPFSQALFLSSFSLVIKIQKKYAWVGWSWASFSITLTPMILCLQYVKEGIKKFQTLLHNPYVPFTWPVAELVAVDRSTKSHFLVSSIGKKTLIWGKKNFQKKKKFFMAFLSPPPPFSCRLFSTFWTLKVLCNHIR